MSSRDIATIMEELRDLRSYIHGLPQKLVESGAFIAYENREARLQEELIAAQRDDRLLTPREDRMSAHGKAVMEELPSIFIGSSTEGIDIAREVELQLLPVALPTIWKDGVFGQGNGTLETLMNVVEQFDFAAMILSPDDLLESRNVAMTSPRDNVLFELGLFMGRLGRNRTFIIHEKDANLKLPSDLAGITISPYKKRDNLSAALSPTCTPIIKAIR